MIRWIIACPAIRWIIAWLLLATPSYAEDLTVLCAGAFKSLAAALIPGFEKTSGNRIILGNDTVGALVQRIKAGEAFDVVVMSPSGLRELTQAGRIIPESKTNVAKVGIGVAVRDDAPKPSIATIAAFKDTMLQARAVAYIDPASGGSSGIYVATLFRTLGIADAMIGRTVLIKGGLAAEAVVDGRADIVIQQISEIIDVPGVTLVGPLPAPIQNETVYAGAVATNSSASNGARAFLASLSEPAARAMMMVKGMMPP